MLVIYSLSGLRTMGHSDVEWQYFKFYCLFDFDRPSHYFKLDLEVECGTSRTFFR